jgi:hypothetical protein
MNHYSSQNNGDKCPLGFEHDFFSLEKAKKNPEMTNMNHSSQNSDDK